VTVFQKIQSLRRARVAAGPRDERERPVAPHEKAVPGDPRHVAVPFAGFVQPFVAEGDTVAAGQALAMIEAMKMEASVTSPRAGTVSRLVIGDDRHAEGGDLLLVLD
jgi:pyruvate carboxylase